MTNGALDKLTGLVFVILGLVVAFGAWQMPRFEDQGAHIYQAPGLTPGLLGLGLAFCGFLLAVRPAKADSPDNSFWSDVFGSPRNRRRALAALILTLGYGGGLFGRVPFILATFLFLFAFIVTFELVLHADDQKRAKPVPVVLIAIGLAAITSVGCQFVFETLFLIRLP